MALPVFQAVFSHAGNPTTAPAATLGTTAAGDVLICVITSGGSNTVPTPGGTYSGGAWTLIDDGQLTTTGDVAVYWSRCTGNHTGQTVTSITVDSGSLTVARYNSVQASGSPIGANKSESITTNAANPGLTAFTTTTADSKVVLAVGADDNLAVITAASATSALTVRSAPASSGGADSQVGIADRDQAVAGTTGAFTTTWGANAAGTGKYLLGFELLGVQPTAHTATPADSVAVADATTRAKGAAAAPADSVAVADATTRVKAASQAPADSVAVADAATRAVAAARVVADSVAVADQAVTAKAIFLTVNDSVGVADGAGASLGKLVAPADSVAVVDQAAPAAAKALAPADAVAVADAAAPASALVRSAADSVTAADAAATSKAIAAAPADSVAVGDQAATEQVYVRAFADATTVTDQATAAQGYVCAAADSVTVTDLAAPVLGSGVNHTLQVDDAVSVADDLARAVAYRRTLVDAVAIGESVVLVLSVSASAGFHVRLGSSEPGDGVALADSGHNGAETRLLAAPAGNVTLRDSPA